MKTPRFQTICLLICMAALILATSCASKQKPVRQLQSIETELETKADDYSTSQWEELIDRYEQTLEDIAQYDYTNEELQQIGEIQGRCAALLLQKSLQKGSKMLSNYAQHAAGLLKGFTDEFNLDNVDFEDCGNSLKSLFGAFDDIDEDEVEDEIDNFIESLGLDD